MTRAAMLRAGYAALGLAFAALAATLAVPTLILGGLALGFLAGILLAFSDDELPKWAGISLVAYFVLTALAFVATTPITIQRGGSNYYFAPPNLTGIILYWIGLVSPLMLAGAGIAAVWERERAPRLLLMASLAGMALFAVLSIFLTPDAASVEAAQRASRSQGDLLRILFALSAAVGAVGALWATARPDEL